MIAKPCAHCLWSYNLQTGGRWQRKPDCPTVHCLLVAVSINFFPNSSRFFLFLLLFFRKKNAKSYLQIETEKDENNHWSQCVFNLTLSLTKIAWRKDEPCGCDWTEKHLKSHTDCATSWVANCMTTVFSPIHSSRIVLSLMPKCTVSHWRYTLLSDNWHYTRSLLLVVAKISTIERNLQALTE